MKHLSNLSGYANFFQQKRLVKIYANSRAREIFLITQKMGKQSREKEARFKQAQGKQVKAGHLKGEHLKGEQLVPLNHLRDRAGRINVITSVSRSCTDVLCCLLFGAFIAAWIVLAVFGMLILKNVFGNQTWVFFR